MKFTYNNNNIFGRVNLCTILVLPRKVTLVLPRTLYNFNQHIKAWKACGSVVGWGTMLQAGGSRVRLPMRPLVILFFVNFAASLWPLSSTQPQTEMSTTNLPGGAKRRSVRKAWQPHRRLLTDHLENMGASTCHYPMGLHGVLHGELYFYSSYHYTEVWK
jgi:hypothetical protein